MKHEEQQYNNAIIFIQLLIQIVLGFKDHVKVVFLAYVAYNPRIYHY